MKKFLALLMALCMMLALVACNNDEGSNTNNPTGKPGEGGGVPAGSLSEFIGDAGLGKFAAGIGMADPNALMQLILGAASDSVDIKDIEIMGATDGTFGLGSVSAKLFGKKYAMNAFVNQSAIIWNAPALTDKAYGISLEDLMALFEGAMGQGQANSAVGMLQTADIDAIVELLDKYYDELLTELQNNSGLTVEQNGENLRLNGTMTNDGLATVAGNLVYTVMTDDEFWAVAEPLLGVTREQVTLGMPDKAGLVEGFKQMLAASNISVKVLVTNFILVDDVPLQGRITVEVVFDDSDDSDDVFVADFSLTEEGMSFELLADDEQVVALSVTKSRFSVKFNDGMSTYELVIKSTPTGAELFYTDGTDHYQGELKTSDNGISLSFKQNEQTLLAFAAEMSDGKLTLTLTMGGQEMVAVLEDTDSKFVGTLTVAGTELGKVVFGKKVSGSRYIITFESLTVQGQKMDLADMGLYFFLDKNPSLPAVPTDYESMADWTQDDVQMLVQQLAQDNPELFSKLFGEQM